MDKPYRFLKFKINSKLIQWKQLITDFDKAKPVADWNAFLLPRDTRKLFNSLGVNPIIGMLWSHYKGVTGDVYHIDGDPSYERRPCVAVNILLAGSPSLTEWIDINKTKFLSNSLSADGKRIENVKYTGGDPDYSAALRPGVPMLHRIDVPHRVNLELIEETRWSYSVRFEDVKTKSALQWDDALIKFESVISDKE